MRGTHLKLYVSRIALVFIFIALLFGIYVLLDAHFSGKPTGGILKAIISLPGKMGRNETVAVTTPEPEPAKPSQHEGVIGQGDTAGTLLQEWLTPGEIQAVADASQDVFALRRLRQGRPYVVGLNEKGELTRFEYEIDSDNKLIISRGDDSFAAKLEAIRYDVILERIDGTIESNLFQTIADAGEAPSLAIALADIFAWEINFIRDIQPGDTFSILVEKRFRDGEFKGYGKLFAATFVNQGIFFEAYRYTDTLGISSYFTSKGESVKRAFLKAPLSFTRISSHFSPNRLHPVLNVWRAHPGVDYAAPTGTPIKAVANGVVTFAGWGQGAGNYIAMKHSQGYETMYLHLSRFAPITKKGKTIRQGEIIGFVGSTGYSTGPHLDFRMKLNGSYINPLKTLSPRSEPLLPKDLPAFQNYMDTCRGYFEDDKKRLNYTPGLLG